MRSNKKNFIKRLKAGKEDAVEYVIDEYLPFVKSIVNRSLLHSTALASSMSV